MEGSEEQNEQREGSRLNRPVVLLDGEGQVVSALKGMNNSFMIDN